MNIIFSEKFKKRFNKLPQKIQQKFKIRIVLFIKNPRELTLKAHLLMGKMVGKRAFSISGDYRVIYRIIDGENIKLLDIGTHNQVY